MENTETKETIEIKKPANAEELFTMEGYEYFKTQMFVPEASRDFFMGAYFNIICSSLLI